MTPVLWDWDYTLEILPLLARASLVTVIATVEGFVLAAIGGLLLALLKMSRKAPLRWAAGAVVEGVRSTPLLIQIYLIYHVLPEYGLALDAMTAGVLALGLHYGCYCAEVYRAGLEGVPAGQWEAAAALNLSTFDTYRRIIIPQAIPPIVPALGNYLVALFKETPLLSAIAVLELMQTAKIIGAETFQYTEPVTLVGLFFLLFSLLSALLVRRTRVWLDRRHGRLPGGGR